MNTKLLTIIFSVFFYNALNSMNDKLITINNPELLKKEYPEIKIKKPKKHTCSICLEKSDNCNALWSTRFSKYAHQECINFIAPFEYQCKYAIHQALKCIKRTDMEDKALRVVRTHVRKIVLYFEVETKEDFWNKEKFCSLKKYGSENQMSLQKMFDFLGTKRFFQFLKRKKILQNPETEAQKSELLSKKNSNLTENN